MSIVAKSPYTSPRKWGAKNHHANKQGKNWKLLGSRKEFGWDFFKPYSVRAITEGDLPAGQYVPPFYENVQLLEVSNDYFHKFHQNWTCSEKKSEIWFLGNIKGKFKIVDSTNLGHFFRKILIFAKIATFVAEACFSLFEGLRYKNLTPLLSMN